MSKFCPNCGHENRDVAIFCGNCGNRLIASNFTSNLRDTGFSTNKAGASVKSSATSNSGDDALSLCCGVIIVLFIIMLIMSMG